MYLEGSVYFASFMPCAECGESVETARTDFHTCNPERRLEYQMLALRGQILAFETLFRVYLMGNKGRFETWMAARDVRRAA
jgi:hypothetical protein